MKRIIICLLMLLSVAACDGGIPLIGKFESLQGGEYGVLFVALPPWMGGGVSQEPILPGGTKFIWSFQKLYRVDTSLQTVGWGDKGQGDNPDVEDYVETRALDGNEVLLSLKVTYRIDPSMVARVIQKVGTNNEEIRRLVAAVAHSDIRTHMNTLNTWDFANQLERQLAVERVKEAMNTRLKEEGIVITAVIYSDHRFERALGEGKYDRSYQISIDQTQATNQETQQEKKKVAAVVEDKRRLLNEEQGRVNRVIAEAEGKKRQAVLQGDAILSSKTVEAEQIRSVGMAEVEGLKKRIAALSGPGGEAMLRLELADYLTKHHPGFVVMNSASDGKGGLDLTKIDANDLLRQAGIFSLLSQEASSKRPAAEAAAK